MGAVGLPRRNLGRLLSSEELFDCVLAAALSLDADGFCSGVFSSFFPSGLGAPGADAGVPVEAGADCVGAGFAPAGFAPAGFDPEGADVEDGAEGGVEPEVAGVVPSVLAGAGVLDVASLLVNRGGASVFSNPFGAFSAFIAVFGASPPLASHKPVASHGTSAFAAWLCSALLTVNRPAGAPVFSPSYTVPDSSAMGTGSAL